MTREYYAGIGSRYTPPDVCTQMTKLAGILGSMGFILRSGGASGADESFELGAKNSQIFLPWNGFRRRYSKHYEPTTKAREIAAKYHPMWKTLDEGARALHARNVHQILGPDCDSPSKFVVCWTKDGCNHGLMRTPLTGGTGQAISIASAYGIPIFNLNRANCWNSLSKYLDIDLITLLK
ncbi:hypothetical protein [Ralstonia phage RP13]|nr:hypothetical protein [Ralstonia phage RP13]